MDAFRDRLCHYTYETYAKSLISQFFDIIIDYPDSKPAIEDLSECMQKTDLRSELVTDLRNALENRLLHPGEYLLKILDRLSIVLTCNCLYLSVNQSKSCEIF